MRMKIGSIVIDCNEFDRMLTFWREALHYVPRKPAQGGWVVLGDPEGKSPNISLNQVPEKRSGKNRLHLDLYTDDREGEVNRLLRIPEQNVTFRRMSPMTTFACWRTLTATFSASSRYSAH